MKDIIGIIVGIWFIGVGAYCLYYAFMMKKTGTLKTGFLVSRDVQLKDSSNLPAFVKVAEKNSRIFGCIAAVGGILFLIAQIMPSYTLMLVCLVVMIAAYIWYSSTLRSAEKKYLAPPLRNKIKRTKK